MSIQCDSSTLADLLKQATALCDDLDKLLAMQYHFYLAVEHCLSARSIPYRNDLSFYPRFLHEKGVDVSETLHTLQQELRDTVKR
jgi:hypothetical protein